MPILRFFLLAAAGLIASATLLLSAEIYIRASPINPAFPGQYAPGSSVVLSSENFTDGSFQWLRNGTPLVGATTSALTLSNLSSANGGNYTLQITRASDVEVSRPFTLNVLPFPASPVDTSFSTTFAANEYPTVVAHASGGKPILQIYGPVQGTHEVLRLQNDGTRDPSFARRSTAGAVLAVFSDDRLLISNPPYRLTSNGADSPLTLPADFDSTKPLTGALVFPNGAFLVAQETRLARYNVRVQL